MKVLAEIITIGDEILIGQITDTNSQWISKKLNEIGIHVSHKTSVGDSESDIKEALRLAKDRADVIIVTGGLGPTKDDITKKTVCGFFDTSLVLDEGTLEHIKDMFEKKGRTITDLNRNQALIPKNCTPIHNEFGTAPGMWFEEKSKAYAFMPGVPYEMKTMVNDFLSKKLQQTFKTPKIFHRTARTIGIAESNLAIKLDGFEASLPENYKLAYLPKLGAVRLRLSATGNTILEEEFQNYFDQLVANAGKYVFAKDDVDIELVIGDILRSQSKTLAIAESCTGGTVSGKITSIPGASDYFLGSVVSYSNDAKVQLLGVNKSTIQEFGAVSENTAMEMAENVRKKFNSDFGLSTTGIAGPGGGSEQKPVGTVWVGYSDSKKTIAKKLTLAGNRKLNIELTHLSLMKLFWRNLKSCHKA